MQASPFTLSLAHFNSYGPVILSGFDYDLNNLGADQGNELSNAFKTIFGEDDLGVIWAAIRLEYPILNIIVRVFVLYLCGIPGLQLEHNY